MTCDSLPGSGLQAQEWWLSAAWGAFTKLAESGSRFTGCSAQVKVCGPREGLSGSPSEGS